MKSFRDCEGREWTIAVNVASLRRVHDRTGLDLTRLIDPRNDVAQKLTTDLFTLYEVLSALLTPQMRRQQVTDEELAESLDEAALEKAADCLVEGIIDFFRGERRTLLRAAYDQARSAHDAKEKQAIDRALATIRTSGDSSSNSPDSSVSTPPPSP